MAERQERTPAVARTVLDLIKAGKVHRAPKWDIKTRDRPFPYRNKERSKHMTRKRLLEKQHEVQGIDYEIKRYNTHSDNYSRDNVYEHMNRSAPEFSYNPVKTISTHYQGQEKLRNERQHPNSNLLEASSRQNAPVKFASSQGNIVLPHAQYNLNYILL